MGDWKVSQQDNPILYSLVAERPAPLFPVSLIMRSTVKCVVCRAVPQTPLKSVVVHPEYTMGWNFCPNCEAVVQKSYIDQVVLKKAFGATVRVLRSNNIIDRDWFIDSHGAFYSDTMGWQAIVRKAGSGWKAPPLAILENWQKL